MVSRVTYADVKISRILYNLSQGGHHIHHHLDSSILYLFIFLLQLHFVKNQAGSIQNIPNIF